MSERYQTLSSSDQAFIREQKIFFLASCSGKEVNLSAKGYDCLWIADEKSLLFMNLVGSGNRTERDIQNGGEATLYFCSFEETPQILRIFCTGEVLPESDPLVQKLVGTNDQQGIRNFVRFDIYCIEKGCGMSIPFYEYRGERKDLKHWLNTAGDEKVNAFHDANKVPPELK